MASPLEIAVKAATEAGRLLKDRLGRVQTIDFKGGINLVTEMDRLSEELIVNLISSGFPDHQILSEEGGVQENSSPFKWIVDPLDGTTNYAHGFPCYSVSIALEEAGGIILGVVYNPSLEELFVCERGRGAFRNGKGIRVSSTRELGKGLLATGFPYDVRERSEIYLDPFRSFLIKARAIRRAGSAALDLCYVACGIFDGFWEMKLHPWDVAAGALMVMEAGGTVTDFKGGPFDHYGKEIVASNGIIHPQMLEVLNRSEL